MYTAIQWQHTIKHVFNNLAWALNYGFCFAYIAEIRQKCKLPIIMPILLDFVLKSAIAKSYAHTYI